MKMKVLIELDVSRTLADTIERTGFTLSADGSKFKVQVPNAPAITQRKVKVSFDRVQPEETK
jgi:hypothetical protein